MNLQELGARLKKARTDMGLTQSKVCESVNIQNVQTLSAYENGNTTPSLDNLVSLSALYQVSVDSLLFGSNALDHPQRSKEFYVKQLVDAADHLKLSFRVDKTESNHIRGVSLELSIEGYSGLKTFAQKWTRLRSLLDSKTIEPDEYEMLINQRLNGLDIREDPFEQQCKQFNDMISSILDEELF